MPARATPASVAASACGLRRTAADARRDQRDEQPERRAEVGHRRELRLKPRRLQAAGVLVCCISRETKPVTWVAAPIIHLATRSRMLLPTAPTASPTSPPTVPSGFTGGFTRAAGDGRR